LDQLSVVPGAWIPLVRQHLSAAFKDACFFKESRHGEDLDKSWTNSLASPQNHCNNYVVID